MHIHGSSASSPSALPEEQSNRIRRFLNSTPGKLTTIVTVLGSIATLWGYIQQPFKKLDEWFHDIARQVVQEEITKSTFVLEQISKASKISVSETLRSAEELKRYDERARTIALEALTSEQGTKSIELVANSVMSRLARERKYIEFAYGFSFRFDGSEIAAAKIPRNRIYFYATENHKVQLSLYFSGQKKFPVDIKINGKPIKRNVHDIRENMDVTPDIYGVNERTHLFFKTNFAPPIEQEEERPSGVHYLELTATTGYVFERSDYYYISGILVVARRVR